MDADRMGSGAVQGEGVATVVSREGFRHLAAGGVSRAEEKDYGVFGHSKKILLEAAKLYALIALSMLFMVRNNAAAGMVVFTILVLLTSGCLESRAGRRQSRADEGLASR
jgi:hypothetical protein